MILYGLDILPYFLCIVFTICEQSVWNSCKCAGLIREMCHPRSSNGIVEVYLYCLVQITTIYVLLMTYYFIKYAEMSQHERRKMTNRSPIKVRCHWYKLHHKSDQSVKDDRKLPTTAIIILVTNSTTLFTGSNNGNIIDTYISIKPSVSARTGSKRAASQRMADKMGQFHGCGEGYHHLPPYAHVLSTSCPPPM